MLQAAVDSSWPLRPCAAPCSAQTACCKQAWLAADAASAQHPLTAPAVVTRPDVKSGALGESIQTALQAAGEPGPIRSLAPFAVTSGYCSPMFYAVPGSQPLALFAPPPAQVPTPPSWPASSTSPTPPRALPSRRTPRASWWVEGWQGQR